MSTERSSFGFNSILPSSYRSKAEAFAKCLQDKLRSLGGADDSPSTANGATTESSNGANGIDFSKYSDEEIADNVFLQGPISYQRRAVPEHTNKPYTNGKSGKYLGNISDKRGFSSDSEDSEDETPKPEPSRRVTELQASQNHRRLASVNSVDSTSSFCSCEDNEEAEDDEEIIDTLASQIKGSPTIHNPRLKNFKRKGREEKSKIEKRPAAPPPPPETDIFFEFDVECFSPVNEAEGDDYPGFSSSQLRLVSEDDPWVYDRLEIQETDDTGQAGPSSNGPKETVTPPPSPIKDLEKFESIVTAKDQVNIDQGDCFARTKDLLISDENEDEINVLGSNDAEEGLSEKSRERLPIAESNESDNCRGELSIEKLELESQPSLVERDTNNVPSHMVNSLQHHKDSVCFQTESDSSPNQQLILNTGIDAVGISNIEETDERIKVPSDNSIWVSSEEGIYENENNFNIEGDNILEDNIISDVESVQTEDKISEEVKIENESEYDCRVTDDADSATTSSAAIPITITACDEDIEVDASYLPSPRMKLRRCSSLKTWKTPPGTPGRKKIVRFADALGLDLADVRTFLDEIPKIPNSAYDDLHYDLPTSAPVPAVIERTLIPMFQQPGTQMDFLQKVRESNVSLESAVLTDVTLLAVAGLVRVRNLSFHKSVHIRYSKDSWVTFSDMQATYVPSSSDGFCDNFSFTLYGHTLSIGDRLEFAIRYDCGAGQFWDNNRGQNYVFQCMPRSPMPLFPPLGSSPVDTWNKFY